tara:strand:+ start:34 stop:255 length:222 start_codon:yes stop_codon:yes gene_type:complete
MIEFKTVSFYGLKVECPEMVADSTPLHEMWTHKSFIDFVSREDAKGWEFVQVDYDPTFTGETFNLVFKRVVVI